MINVKLTVEQSHSLRQVSRHAVGRIALRAQMVLLSHRKFSVPQIATIHDCGEEVVRHWLHRYEEHGIEGLEDEPKSGRPRKEPLAEQIVDVQASQSPRCSGHVHSCWSVRRLTAFLDDRFHLALSPSTIRRLLRASGWRWRRPRLAPASTLSARRDPDTEEKLARIAAAHREAEAGRLQILYLDECDLHLLPVVRSMWMKGERKRISTPGKNAKWAFFGARNALTDAWHWTDHSRKLAVNFVAFLEQLVREYPTGSLVFVLDSAPAHTAKVVQKWLAQHDRVEQLWLPKYAAHEANPVERVWGLMKDAVAANRLCGSIDLLTQAARRFFQDLRLPKARLDLQPLLRAA